MYIVSWMQVWKEWHDGVRLLRFGVMVQGWWVAADGSWKIADCGLARLAHPTSVSGQIHEAPKVETGGGRQCPALYRLQAAVGVDTVPKRPVNSGLPCEPSKQLPPPHRYGSQ